jgi:hypothetical protein
MFFNSKPIPHTSILILYGALLAAAESNIMPTLPRQPSVQPHYQVVPVRIIHGKEEVILTQPVVGGLYCLQNWISPWRYYGNQWQVSKYAGAWDHPKGDEWADVDKDGYIKPWFHGYSPMPQYQVCHRESP